MNRDYETYVPARSQQSVVWKICRNLAYLWAAIVALLYVTSLDTNTGFVSFLGLASPSAVLLVIGICFKR